MHGVRVNWAAVTGSGERVELPTYAFQHQRYWPQPSAGTGWRYKITWAPVPEPAPGRANRHLAARRRGRAGRERPAAEECARALAAHGARLLVVEAVADEPDRALLAARIGQAVAGADGVAGTDGVARVRGVLSLLALDEASVAGCPAVPAGLALTQALVQALGDADVSAPLWVLTCGAVALAGEVLASPVQAMAWGLGRVAGLELPERWGGLVDVPAVPDERAWARLCGVLTQRREDGCGEDQVAIRPAGVMARRLTRAEPPRDTVPWAPEGTVLVTGGTGAIAGHVARWVASRGAPHIVLASRSGPGAAQAAALAAELAGMGTAAEGAVCDVTDRAQVAGLVARIQGGRVAPDGGDACRRG